MAKKGQPALAAMEGYGFYNRNSSVQAAGIRQVLPRWAQTASAVVVGNEPVVIADYGSSQGRNSLAPIRVAIEAVRARVGPDRPVQVIHTDLPSNDFASLFKTLDDDPDSYLAGNAGIFPSAVGRSYFDPILPPGHVHLAWNSWTLHWLSRKPPDVPDHVMARQSAIPALRDAVATLAAADWRRFLAARATELRPGGKLLSLIIIAAGEPRSADRLGDELWNALVEMDEAGLLSPQERLKITLPTHPRTLASIKEPFTDRGRFAGLQLEQLDAIKVPDPFWGGFERTADAAAWARSWANMARAIFGPTVMGAIDPDRDRHALLSDMFERFASRLVAAPGRIDFDLAVALLAKLR